MIASKYKKIRTNKTELKRKRLQNSGASSIMKKKYYKCIFLSSLAGKQFLNLRRCTAYTSIEQQLVKNSYPAIQKKIHKYYSGFGTLSCDPKNKALKNNLFVPNQAPLKFGLSANRTTRPLFT